MRALSTIYVEEQEIEEDQYGMGFGDSSEQRNRFSFD